MNDRMSRSNAASAAERAQGDAPACGMVAIG